MLPRGNVKPDPLAAALNVDFNRQLKLQMLTIFRRAEIFYWIHAAAAKMCWIRKGSPVPLR